LISQRLDELDSFVDRVVARVDDDDALRRGGVVGLSA
jgi:hypothetical protein